MCGVKNENTRSVYMDKAKMKLLPKIKITDDLPFTPQDRWLGDNEAILGHFDIETFEIYILKQPGCWCSLLHELGHWLIELFSKRCKADKRHAWYDKKLSYKVAFLTEIEKEQIRRRIKFFARWK